MSSQKQRMRTETRITRHFSIEDKKFRLCYTPRGGFGAVSIQLNYRIAGIGPFVLRIVRLGKYRSIRIYLNQKYVEDSRPAMQQFLDTIAAPGYRITTPDTTESLCTSQEEYVLICIIERE